MLRVFMKSKKKSWLTFDQFLINQGKNEDEDNDIWKNKHDFWTVHSKTRRIRRIFIKIFIKILEKKSWLDFDWFLTNSEKNEDEDEEISESKFDFWLNDPQKI